MSACRDLELLVSLGAAGALSPEESARLDAHLSGCAACRADFEASAKALGLARMPPPSRAEQRLVAELPERMIEEVRRGDRRRGLGRRFVLAASIAAVFAVALLLPARLGVREGVEPRAVQEAGTGGSAQTELATAATPGSTSTWQEPDIDTVWQETDLVDFADDTDTASGWGTQ